MIQSAWENENSRLSALGGAPAAMLVFDPTLTAADFEVRGLKSPEKVGSDSTVSEQPDIQSE